MKIFNQKQIAALFFASPKQVSRWEAAGMPFIREQVADENGTLRNVNLHDPIACLAWLIETNRLKHVPLVKSLAEASGLTGEQLLAYVRGYVSGANEVTSYLFEFSDELDAFRLNYRAANAHWLEAYKEKMEALRS